MKQMLALGERVDVAFRVGRAVALAGGRVGVGSRGGRHFRLAAAVFRAGRATATMMMRA